MAASRPKMIGKHPTSDNPDPDLEEAVLLPLASLDIGVATGPRAKFRWVAAAGISQAVIIALPITAGDARGDDGARDEVEAGAFEAFAYHAADVPLGTFMNVSVCHGARRKDGTFGVRVPDTGRLPLVGPLEVGQAGTPGQTASIVA